MTECQGALCCKTVQLTAASSDWTCGFLTRSCTSPPLYLRSVLFVTIRASPACRQLFHTAGKLCEDQLNACSLGTRLLDMRIYRHIFVSQNHHLLSCSFSTPFSWAWSSQVVDCRLKSENRQSPLLSARKTRSVGRIGSTKVIGRARGGLSCNSGVHRTSRRHGNRGRR